MPNEVHSNHATQQLENENRELRERLRLYKELQQDIDAQKIFEKAKKQLTSWITLGGLLLLVVSLVGLKLVSDYAKQLARDKIEQMGKQEIEKLVRDEGYRQADRMFQQERGELNVYFRQRIDLVTGPIKSLSAEAPSSLEAKLDYSPRMLPVRDQGGEASVVGFAIAAAVEYQIRAKLQKQIEISPRYIYYFAKVKAGTDPHQDTGAGIKDALEVVATRGAVPEESWPYKPQDLKSNPPQFGSAEFYKIKEFHLVKSLEGLKVALKQSGPVVAGLTVFPGAEESEATKTGVFPMPPKGESSIGNLAVCIVGYDDAREQLKFRNSWGAEWGDHGYGYLPYSYFEQYAEAWTISM